MLIDDLNNFKVSAASPFAVAAAAVTTDAMDLGTGGMAYDSLYLTVALSVAFSAGNMTTVKLQTATDSAFTTPIDIETYNIPAAIDQTKPALLVQQNLPVGIGLLRYVRLVLTPTGAGAGASIYAMLTTDTPVR
ncbi:MAG: hypothetical protein P4N59_07430 [Negativicutes bacterium]|nr:hypothetical protein [Negativicutes bacterium]